MKPDDTTPVAAGLRERYALAAAEWALMYPISSWALADGEKAVRLAKVWGEQIARFLDESVRDEHLAHMTARAEKAETALDQLRAYARWCRDRSVEPDERDILELANGSPAADDYVALMASDAPAGGEEKTDG